MVNKCDEKMAESGQWSNQSDWTDFWETAVKKAGSLVDGFQEHGLFGDGIRTASSIPFVTPLSLKTVLLSMVFFCLFGLNPLKTWGLTYPGHIDSHFRVAPAGLQKDLHHWLALQQQRSQQSGLSTTEAGVGQEL